MSDACCAHVVKRFSSGVHVTRAGWRAAGAQTMSMAALDQRLHVREFGLQEFEERFNLGYAAAAVIDLRDVAMTPACPTLQVSALDSAGASIPGSFEGIQRRPARSDPIRSDPIRSDPIRSDPIRSDPIRSESDPIRSDPDLPVLRVRGRTPGSVEVRTEISEPREPHAALSA
jgi:hypothetical protein